MSDALDRLEAGLYELCRICQGAQSDDYGPCVECDGKGLVLHECPDEE